MERIFLQLLLLYAAGNILLLMTAENLDDTGTLFTMRLMKTTCGINVIPNVMPTSLLTFFQWNRVLVSINNFIMRLTKLFDSPASFGDQVFRNGQHNAEERWVEEAGKAGKGLNTLFFGESLRKVQTSRELRKSVKFNANHHVHRWNMYLYF